MRKFAEKYVRFVHHSAECCLQSEEECDSIGYETATVHDRVWYECHIVYSMQYKYGFNDSTTTGHSYANKHNIRIGDNYNGQIDNSWSG